jgi:hypothetical protein
LRRRPGATTAAQPGGARWRAAESSPVRRGDGAGVHHSTRGFHQDDGKRTVSTTASSKSGEDGSTRRTARRRGGGAPVSRSRRDRARACLQEAPVAPLPSGEGAGTTAGRRKLGSTAAAARDGGGTDELGFGRRESTARVRSTRGGAL